MNTQIVFNEVDRLKDKYIKVLEDVCNIASPTNCKAGVDNVGKYFTDMAEEMGLLVEVSHQEISGDAICFTLNPESCNPGVAFSGHMDTVYTEGSYTEPVRIEGDRIYGPGVFDCKGGIVAAMLAVEALKNCEFNKRAVLILLQSDEENSSITSNKKTVDFMIEKAKNCIAFLNCEGAESGKITVERKGIIRYLFEIEGIGGHSAACFECANAVTEAAYKIIELEKWKESDGITCNCGVIAGGTVANSVAENCTFLADIRYKTDEELKLIKKRVEEIANTSYVSGTRCKLSVKSERVSMEKKQEKYSII